jgi:hypothetical protein
MTAIRRPTPQFRTRPNRIWRVFAVSLRSIGKGSARSPKITADGGILGRSARIHAINNRSKPPQRRVFSRLTRFLEFLRSKNTPHPITVKLAQMICMSSSDRQTLRLAPLAQGRLRSARTNETVVACRERLRQRRVRWADTRSAPLPGPCLAEGRDGPVRGWAVPDEPAPYKPVPVLVSIMGFCGENR